MTDDMTWEKDGTHWPDDDVTVPNATPRRGPFMPSDVIAGVRRGTVTRWTWPCKPQPPPHPSGGNAGMYAHLDGWRYGDCVYEGDAVEPCPYGPPGTVLWLPETYASVVPIESGPAYAGARIVEDWYNGGIGLVELWYRADGEIGIAHRSWEPDDDGVRWVPAARMPGPPAPHARTFIRVVSYDVRCVGTVDSDGTHVWRMDFALCQRAYPMNTDLTPEVRESIERLQAAGYRARLSGSDFVVMEGPRGIAMFHVPGQIGNLDVWWIPDSDSESIHLARRHLAPAALVAAVNDD